MKRKLTTLLILGLLIGCGPLFASHIVGGYMKYDCISSGKYHFTLTVYRNCNSQAQDNFDSQAPITIWRGDGSGPYEMIMTRMVPLNNPVTEIPVLLFNPCIEPPDDFCVQEGTYDFEVDLPISNESYHITYQRCCRNWNIANIEDPRNTGSTFTIELTPKGQEVCNNSPDFVSYPPPIICVNQPWNFDHSASDADGDQLIYEFCAPLEGAGIIGAYEPGDPTICEGFRPNPACAPPYFGVNFILPNYSALEPMGGNPIIRMNQATGNITGTPQFQGQYSVGVCVSEYRNGELLSVLRRDVQFTVVECVQLVDAILDDNIFELENNTYKLKQCGAEPIVIDNFSIGQNYVDDFYWEINGVGNSWTFDTWNIDLGLLDPGHYEGILHLNPNTIGCNDSTFLEIDVFENPDAQFVYFYDTCSIEPVAFINTSLAPDGLLETFDWNFGLDKSSEQNPTYQFPDPGDFPITLKIEDVNGCRDSIVNEISWFPAPEVIVIEPNTFDGCPPLGITFENLSWPIDDTYDLTWTFDQAGTSDQISPSKIFTEVDVYDVSLKIVSPFNCEIEEYWPNWITVHPNPTSSFEITKAPVDILEAEVSLETTSPDGEFWDWVIPGFPISYGRTLDITMQDTGFFEVMHIVENEFGCLDTSFQKLYVEPVNTFFMPNAFTPNGDGKNELFMGKGLLMGASGFNLRVWNRWGELIFESNSAELGWNGKKNNIGRRAPMGAYPYELHYTRYDGEFVSKKGMVTLIR